MQNPTFPEQNVYPNNYSNQYMVPQNQTSSPIQNISLQNNFQYGISPKIQNFTTNISSQNNLKNNEYQIIGPNPVAQNVAPTIPKNQFSMPLGSRFPVEKNHMGTNLPNLKNIGGSPYGKISQIPQITKDSAEKYSIHNNSNKNINNQKDINPNLILTNEDKKYFSDLLKNNKNIDQLTMLPLMNPEHIKRHDLEFMFIPNILTDLYSKGTIDDNIIMNPPLWKKYYIYNKISPVFLQKIAVQKKLLKSGVTKFIMSFPPPKCGCECFFAILYFDEYKNSSYFTLELEFGNDFGSTEGTGLVCGQKGFRHLNFNTICKVNLEDFENCVRKLYKED